MWGVLRALAFSLAFLLLTTFPAAAGGKWCEDDPLISVNGRTAHVTTGLSVDDIAHLDGKLTYVVVVAQSYYASTVVDASMATLPTQTYVYAVSDDQMKSWKGDTIKVVVLVRVPGKKVFPTITTVTDFSQAQLAKRGGKSNQWIEVDFRL